MIYPSINTSLGPTYPSIDTSSGHTYQSINTSSGLTYPSINTYLIRPDSSATNWSVPTPIRTCSKNNRFTCITQFCSDQEPKMKFLGKGQLEGTGTTLTSAPTVGKLYLILFKINFQKFGLTF